MTTLEKKVDRLDEDVKALAPAVEALAENVSVDQTWRRRLTIALTVAAAVGVAVAVSLLLLNVNVLHQSGSNGQGIRASERSARDAAASAKAAQQSLDRLNECTTPGPPEAPNKCYADGHATTDAAVGKLITGNSYGLECVIAGRTDVEACVNERFAGAPPASPATTAPRRGTNTTSTTTARRRASATSSSGSGTTATTQTPTTIDPCDLRLQTFCVNKPASGAPLVTRPDSSVPAKEVRVHLLAVVQSVTLDLGLLSKLVGVLLPLLVGLVTKKRAPAWLKAVLLALLAAVAGVITDAISNGGTIVVKQAIDAGLTAWVLGVGSYYGLHKPAGIAAAVQNVAPNVGIGAASPPPEARPPAPRQRAAAKKTTTGKTR